MRYPALVSREGPNWLIEFPDCPGCQTFARSEADVTARAREALEGWLEVAREDGEAPPAPGNYDPPPGAQLVEIELYARDH